MQQLQVYDNQNDNAFNLLDYFSYYKTTIISAITTTKQSHFVLTRLRTMSEQESNIRRSARTSVQPKRLINESLPNTNDCSANASIPRKRDKSLPKQSTTNTKTKKKKKENIAELNTKLEEAAKLGTVDQNSEQICRSLKNITERVSKFWTLLDREQILAVANQTTISTGDNLLLFRVLQDDINFNKKIMSDKDSTARSYSVQQRNVIVKCVAFLHHKYYGVELFANAPEYKKHSSGHTKNLFCRQCGQCFISIQNFENKENKDTWCPINIAFNHLQEECYTPLTNIAGYGEYRVDQSVLDAAKQIELLAQKWYIAASKSPKHSILHTVYKGDNRYYGLFYLELAIMKQNGGDEVIQNLLKGFSMEEANDFNRFYDETKPTDGEQKYIMEVVALFLEDFKFVKKLHQSFADNKHYLGAVGFLAGGDRHQLLHCDVTKIPLHSEDPELPLSVLLPIATKGRNIFFNSLYQGRCKHHVQYGKAVFFDGNIPHAGALSEAENRLDNLALHIHIDSIKFFRPPNILLLVGEDNNEQELSTDENTSDSESIDNDKIGVV